MKYASITIRRDPGRRLGARGLAGAGGGSPAYVPVPLEWRGTTRQVCGLYPWATPGQLPMLGGPIGRHQKSGAIICFDHVNWFLGKRISNPSVLIIARTGLGKSTLSSKIMLSLAAQGYVLLIPGDTKPDYAELVAVLGGQVRVVSRAGGMALNPADPGGMSVAAARIGGVAADALLSEAIGRATVACSSLIELARKGQPVQDYEEAAVNAALRLLYERGRQAPVLRDVFAVLEQRAEAVRAVVLDRGVDATYERLIGPTQRSIQALLNGQYRDLFGRPVDRSVERSPAMSIDTSRIKSGDERFLAAVMMAAWSETYGQVEAEQALADAGLSPRRLYCLTLDELWRVLQLGGTMPERLNELTRLNRTQGVGQIMITHSIRDLARGERSNIEGIEERAGAIIVGGVPKREIDALSAVMTLTEAEQCELRTWWSMYDAAARGDHAGDRPPGAGLFLIKPSSEDPGIPVDVVLTSVEREWGGQNTNRAWTQAS